MSEDTIGGAAATAAAAGGDGLDEALSRAVEGLASLQEADGSWKGDYSGPLFLLPMYVGACHVTGAMPEADVQAEMIRYLRGVQNEDGGFGLGEENGSCVFTSVLCYVAWRLLGVPADDPDAQRARAWFLPRGGALGSASWGRFFLCILNLHDWDGVHPVPPELWSLPTAVPFHPTRMWCHSRMVYLPMAWLYGARATAPLDATLAALREEIYATPYAQIRWKQTRDHVDAVDAFSPRTRVYGMAMTLLGAVEAVLPGAVRRRSLAHVLDHIAYEDRVSDSICIGPVNKVYNLLVWHFANPGGPEIRKHLTRLPDYLVADDRGVRMNGYNSSQLWDTAFAAQALVVAGHGGHKSTQAAWRFIDAQQVRVDPPDRHTYHRDRTLGGWPFSTQAHGWPITDCTAEGVKIALMLLDHVETPIEPSRLHEAVDLILGWQNEDGGWASYERTRGPAWMELLNPSDIFSDIMVDYSYVECSSACLQALAKWLRHFSGHERAPAAREAMRRGEAYIRSKQRPDGGWFGSWGVCMTYGTWFGVSGLRACGAAPDDPAIQAAARYLLALQGEDGGWGESIEACRQQRYVATPTSQVVMTSWAILALLDAGMSPDDPAIVRARGVLLSKQRPDGTWPREAIAGVFNKTCSITYDVYRNLFPIWAMGRLTRP